MPCLDFLQSEIEGVPIITMAILETDLTHRHVTTTPSEHEGDSGRPKKKPKVLHYYPDFGAYGGIEQHIQQICSLLLERGTVEPVVACTAHGIFHRRLKLADIPTRGLYTLPLFANVSLRVLDVFSMAQLMYLVQKEQPDLVHVHVGQGENLFFRMLEVPLVYTYHGYGSLYNWQSASHPIKRFIKKQSRPLFRSILPYLDRFIGVSQAEVTRLRQQGYLPPDFQPTVIHNGLPVESLRITAMTTDTGAWKQQSGIPVDAQVVSFINRLDANKNPLLFLRLAEQLSLIPELAPLHFVVAGDGPLRKQLERELQVCPIRDRVHLLGQRQDVPSILASSDLAVFLPENEGFGLGVLEAMATGTLLLAHATGGISELLDFPDGDLFKVQPGDFLTLVHKAVDLLQLNAQQRFGLASTLQHRAMAFDIERCVVALEDIYNEIVQELSFDVFR